MPSAPKPIKLSKGRYIARIIGSLSGMVDQLGFLQQNARDISARAAQIIKENAEVDLLANSQREAIQKLVTRFDNAFDSITETRKLIDEIYTTLRGEKE